MNSISGKNPRTGESLTVRHEHGVIRDIVPGPASETRWLGPGLIDIQVNGYEGWDLNAGAFDAQTVLQLARAMQRVGVSTFLPTLITAGEDSIVNGLQVIRQAREADPIVAHMIPYVHVEGPSLSSESGPRGAHPEDHIRPPDPEEFLRWQNASGGLVGMLTISPHWDNSIAFITALCTAGIHVAIGHTHATVEQIRAAVDAGARLSTHLGNGAHGNLRRHPNYLWTQLAEDRLCASFIADGHHLPVDTLKVMLRAKGLERSILVSDTAALGGMPVGVYEHPIGGKVSLSADGRLSVVGTDFLAGATLPLTTGIRHVIDHLGFDLASALKMATENPGRFVQKHGRRGVIEVGAAADLMRFQWDGPRTPIAVDTLVVNGNTVFAAENRVAD